MKNSKLISWGIINSLGSFLYIAGVAWLMFNGEHLFGKEDNFWMPVALLLLFVLSATIVGALVLGRPIYFYLGGAKQEALKLLFYTISGLLIITIIIFLILIAAK